MVDLDQGLGKRDLVQGGGIRLLHSANGYTISPDTVPTMRLFYDIHIRSLSLVVWRKKLWDQGWSAGTRAGPYKSEHHGAEGFNAGGFGPLYGSAATSVQKAVTNFLRHGARRFDELGRVPIKHMMVQLFWHRQFEPFLGQLNIVHMLLTVIQQQRVECWVPEDRDLETACLAGVAHLRAMVGHSIPLEPQHHLKLLGPEDVPV